MRFEVACTAVLAVGANFCSVLAISTTAHDILERAPPGHLHFLQPAVPVRDDAAILRGSTYVSGPGSCSRALSDLLSSNWTTI